MERYLQQIIKFNVIYLLGIFKNTDNDKISLLMVKRNKDQLKIILNNSFDKIDEALKILNPSFPVILLVDGKGVLNKKINLNDETETEWLNNLDYSGIYYTSYRNEDYELLSFCRKSVVDELEEIVVNRGLTLIDFYIGTSAALLIRDSIGTSEYYANLTHVKYINNKLIEFKKSEEKNINQEYKIGEETISNYHLPLYGAGVDFYIKSSSIRKSEPDEKKKSELIFKKTFNKVGVFVLVFFLLTLLISYFSIQFLIQKNAKLALENKYTGKSFEEIQILEKKLNSKLSILNETGLSSRKYFSFYCYEISADLPEDLLLNTLEVNPLQKEIKKTEKLMFNANQIYIKGETQNKLALNKWFEQLKEKKWVNRLEIVSIKKDKKENTFFELKIILSDV